MLIHPTAMDYALPIVIYFVLILILVLAKRRYFNSRLLQLLRIFFPSWRFFEDIDEPPQLYYRTGTEPNSFTHWRPCIEKIERKWHQLFLNAQGNTVLAYQTLLHQLIDEIAELPDEERKDLEKKVSYQLAKRLARLSIPHPYLHTHFQFKLCSGADDLLISPSYSLENS